MGCTVRDKHIRSNRRARSAKTDTGTCCHQDRAAISEATHEHAVNTSKMYPGLNSGQNPIPVSVPNSNPNSHPKDEENGGWGYCTEEQLEEVLLRNLEFLYNEAVAKLVSSGYDEAVAVEAILRNGYCYGSIDELQNIVRNSLEYLRSVDCGGNADESEVVFSDLRQLRECSLAGMICMLQQVRPHLSKGDAMWCLLTSDLDVGRASAMEIPVLPSPANANVCSVPVCSGVDTSAHEAGVMLPALCRFHGGWGFGNDGASKLPVDGFFSYGAELTLQRDIECPKRFNLSPTMKSLLRRNVAAIAAGYRAKSKQMQTQTKASIDALPNNAAPVSPSVEVPAEQSGDSQNLKNQDITNTIMDKLRDLNLEGNLELETEDRKDEVVVTLLHQVELLEKQVKERREWAQKKAMQAATKLSNDLTQLKLLRMEREENQKLKKGKQTLEDSTMKRLSDLENSLRKTSGQAERANAAARRLEMANAEIRAEMEACKLSASESAKNCMKVEKRERKCKKKLAAWDKQKAKLEKEISDEKEKILELQRNLVQIKQIHKETELKWKEETRAKEEASALVDEERRSKEVAESNNKRNLEALRLKIEIDFQRHKDDLQRLEQELSRLKPSAQSTDQPNRTSLSPARESSDKSNPEGETIAALLKEMDKLDAFSEEELSIERKCIICLKDEVSIVFLPCAHQVMCASCGDDYGRKGKATCPCCRVPIEQRIHVFGASS